MASKPACSDMPVKPPLPNGRSGMVESARRPWRRTSNWSEEAAVNAAAPAPAVRPARRGRPGYDLDSLLAVVVTVFNERGYDGTSMEDLSARLGIGKSSIYHHVEGKAELLRLQPQQLRLAL